MGLFKLPGADYSCAAALALIDRLWRLVAELHARLRAP